MSQDSGIYKKNTMRSTGVDRKQAKKNKTKTTFPSILKILIRKGGGGGDVTTVQCKIVLA